MLRWQKILETVADGRRKMKDIDSWKYELMLKIKKIPYDLLIRRKSFNYSIISIHPSNHPSMILSKFCQSSHPPTAVTEYKSAGPIKK